MSKAKTLGIILLLIAGGTSFAHAQTLIQKRIAEQATELMDADSKDVTDRRIDLMKAALQLTPEQEKLWGPVEQAIRARADYRYARLQEASAPKAESRDIIDLMHARAKNMEARGQNLEKLADAWQPLYQTLKPDQKKRMAMLTLLAFREARDAAEERRMQMEDQVDSFEY